MFVREVGRGFYFVPCEWGQGGLFLLYFVILMQTRWGTGEAARGTDTQGHPCHGEGVGAWIDRRSGGLPGAQRLTGTWGEEED